MEGRFRAIGDLVAAWRSFKWSLGSLLARQTLVAMLFDYVVLAIRGAAAFSSSLGAVPPDCLSCWDRMGKIVPLGPLSLVHQAR